MRTMSKEMRAWVREAWMIATSMHACLYENWCTEENAEKAYKQVEKLVRETASRIKKSQD